MYTQRSRNVNLHTRDGAAICASSKVPKNRGSAYECKCAYSKEQRDRCGFICELPLNMMGCILDSSKKCMSKDSVCMPLGNAGDYTYT